MSTYELSLFRDDYGILVHSHVSISRVLCLRTDTEVMIADQESQIRIARIALAIAVNDSYTPPLHDFREA